MLFRSGCACVCCILTDATRRDTAVVFIGCFVVSIVGDRSCFGLVRVRVKGPGFVHLQLASFVVGDERDERCVPSGPAGLSRGGDRQTDRQTGRPTDLLGVLRWDARQRSYHAERTGSRQIPAVKHRRVSIVPGWVTAWEVEMLLARLIV